VVERIFVDTSAWAAYANRSDPDHDGVCSALERFAGRRVTSNFVFDETVTLCRYRFGHRVAVAIGAALVDRAVVELIRITPRDERAAWELFRRRADKKYSFTDCTTFVLMRRLGIETAAALDRDFVREGFALVPREQ